MSGKKKNEIDVVKIIKKDPLKCAMLVVTIISVCIAGYFGIKNYNLNKENYELIREKSELEKPIIFAPRLKVMGGSVNVDFPFYVKNPSDNEYYIDLTRGGCIPDSELLTKSEKKNKEDGINVGENISIMEIREPQTLFFIPPHEKKILYCSNFDVKNPTNNTLVKMKICIKEKRLSEDICDELEIVVLKNRELKSESS